MPEGPECLVIAESLNAKLKGKQILAVRIKSGRYTRKAPVGWDTLNSALPLLVNSVKVKGKFIYFDVESHCARTFIFNTLGMTGGWTEHPTPATRVELDYTDGTLYYNDQRNFGTFKFGMTADDLNRKLEKDLGIDLMTSHTEEHIDQACELFKFKRNLTKTLPEVLMNQKNFPGVGNYIKAEVLYRARLSPHRTADGLSDQEARSLVLTIADVLQSSYRSKRVSLVDYRDMQECGQEFRKVVYKQTKDPLGNLIKAEETKDNRTTYWVPAVQR